LKNCRLCPRECGVDRIVGQVGRCGVAGNEVKVARAALHFWEEPGISGDRGSGAIFFCGCNLGCVYCQNRTISRGDNGKPISIYKLAQLMLRLQDQGAHNINLVTPTHYLLAVKQALLLAKSRGLSLPIVYNCGGYESADALRELEGLISVYLPDFKYWEGQTALKYSKAADYPTVAKAAIGEMVRQVGGPVFDKNGMMQKGVVVRHLVLPTLGQQAKQIISYLFETYGHGIWMSIMNQYTPMKGLPFFELTRPVSREEYEQVVSFAVSIGVENAWIQQGGTVSESFIPQFDEQDF
jgi:putative pyruvate formate lyase activating enzyme